MEPVTQGLLGAAVAQAGWRHRIGRRALLWGALVGMLPDLDVIFVGLHNGFGEFLYHRGTSHSLWFGFVVGPLIGAWLWRRSGRQHSFATWAGLCIAALVTHPLLDAFTPYGTQLLAPFDRTRFAWQGIAIIDPAYTAILAVAVAIGVWRGVGARTARNAALAALALSTAYLFYGIWLNDRAEDRVRAELRAEGLEPQVVRVYPTFLQTFLRRVVARGPDGVRVGLHTPFGDGRPYWEGGFSLIEPGAMERDLLASWEGRTFTWFAMQETVTHRQRLPGGTTLVSVEDLRYSLPGDPPNRGLWGIRARYDGRGERIGEVQRYSRRRSGRIAPLLWVMWRATWGDYSGMLVEPNDSTILSP
jgi:inner membrane protein